MIDIKNIVLNNEPFPYFIKNNVIDNKLLYKIQKEILSIPENQFDILDNVFENKTIIRNKFNYPPLCSKLMEFFTSDTFITDLSNIFNIKLINDIDRNFWGIHKFKNGDKLDIHLDAGIYHKNNKRKAVTIGLYASKDWTLENKGNLELWKGQSCTEENYCLDRCITSISPLFNTFVAFMNTNNSWHGSPEPVVCNDDSTRIFITCSYLTEEPCNIKNMNHLNKKALFIQRPFDKYNKEKLEAIYLRSNPDTCNKFFNTTI